MSRKILHEFKRQFCVIESEFSVLAWFFCVMPEVRKDVVGCNIEIHQNAVERTIAKLFLHDVDANMGQVISDLWAKEKYFRKRTVMYSEQYQWNIPYVDKGKSAV